MENGSIMKVKVLQNAPLGAFCNTFDLHEAIIGLENQFFVFFLSGRLRQILLYILTLFSPFTAIVICFLICLYTIVASTPNITGLDNQKFLSVTF